MTAGENPYVGPASFAREDADRFFGRDQEAQSLRALVSSEELVLFYAQSGAGKTSLVNARLVSGLEHKGYEVHTVAGIGGESRPHVDPANVFVFNVLASLAPDRDDPELGRRTLAEFLGPGNGRRRVLVIDQFEELLTAHPQRRQDRAGFFEQLQEALDADPRLSVLLVMREDRIAGLDEYIPFVRNHLRARFRMEKLRCDAALAAICEPAERAGRPFADRRLAAKLVGTLSRERVAGRHEPVAGEYVEPFQLQVVCYRLWESLPAGGGKITRQDVEAVNVDRALEDFYRETVEEVAGDPRAGASEEEIRRWFGAALITSQGLRARAVLEGDRVGALPVRAVRMLEDRHLIRAEEVGGGRWFQLIHDRFVEPIRTSNDGWLRRQSKLADAAWAWEDGDPGYLSLFHGRRRREAAAWAEAHPRLLTERERRFLEAARRVDLKRRGGWIVGLSGLAAILLGLLVAVISLSRTAGKLDRSRLELGEVTLDADPAKSLRLALEVLGSSFVTKDARQQAEALLRDGLYADRLRPLWGDGSGAVRLVAWGAGGTRLATVAETDEEGGRPPPVRIWDVPSGRPIVALARRGLRVVRLAIDSDASRVIAVDAERQLWDLTADQSGPSTVLEDEVEDVALSPDGAWIAVAGRTTGTVTIRDAETLQPVRTLEIPGVDRPFVTFSADGRCLAMTSEDAQFRLWAAPTVDAAAWAPRTLPTEISARTMAFNRDCSHIAAAGGESMVRLRNGGDWTNLTAKGPVEHVTFGDDDHYLIATTANGRVQIWNVHSRTQVSSSVVAREDRAEGRDELTAIPSPGGRYLLRKNPRGFEILELVLEDVETFVGHGAAVTAVSFDRAGRRLATASDDHTVKLWDVETRQPSWSKEMKGRSPRAAVSPDGRFVAGTSSAGLSLWNAATGEPIPASPEAGDGLSSLAFRPDSRHLATGDERGLASLWDVESGRLLKRYEAEARINGLAFDPPGRLLAAATDGGTVVFDADSGAVVRRLTGLRGPVIAVAFSPDGLLATAGDDGVAGISDPLSGELHRVLENPDSGPLYAIAYSPDGRQLAAAGSRRVVLWNPGSGRQLTILPVRSGDALAVAFHAASLAVAGSGGTVRLEPLRPSDLADRARKRLANPRNDRLSQESR